MENIDVERFLREIRSRKAIWDCSSTDYKSRQLKRDQWIEIYSIFFPGYHDMDPKEKANVGTELNAKWRNIRDCYVRSLRMANNKSGQKRKKVKTYIYSQHLDFLKSITTLHSTQSSENQDKPDVGGNSEESSDGEVAFHTTSSTHKRKSTIPGEKAERFLNHFESDRSTAKGDNGDMDFFRSLVPILDQLPLEQKIKFRIEVMNLALKYKEGKSSQIPNMIHSCFSSAQLPFTGPCSVQQLLSYISQNNQVPSYGPRTADYGVTPPKIHKNSRAEIKNSTPSSDSYSEDENKYSV